MNYDDMPAGMAMNKLVAMNVMGWHEWDGWDDYDGPYPMFSGWPDIDGVAVYEEGDDNYNRWFDPSSDPESAVEVLTKIRKDGWWMMWEAAPCEKDDDHLVNLWNGVAYVVAEAATFPLAACRAALKAVSE